MQQLLMWTSRFHYVHSTRDCQTTAIAVLCTFPFLMDKCRPHFWISQRYWTQARARKPHRDWPASIKQRKSCASSSWQTQLQLQLRQQKWFAVFYLPPSFITFNLKRGISEYYRLLLLIITSPLKHTHPKHMQKMWSSPCALSINTGIFSKDMSTSHGHQ